MLTRVTVLASVAVVACAVSAACGGGDSGGRVTPRAGVPPPSTTCRPTNATYLGCDAILPPPPGFCETPQECNEREGITVPTITVRLSVTEGLEDLPESASLPTPVAVGTTVAAATTVPIHADVEPDEEPGSPCPQAGDSLPQAFDVCSGPDGIEPAVVMEYDDGCALLIWTSGWGQIGGAVADDTWDKHTADGLPIPCAS